MTIMHQPDVWSVGIQCDLLVAPPLKKLQYKVDNIIEEFLPSETERAGLDTSFHNTVNTNSLTPINIILIDVILK